MKPAMRGSAAIEAGTTRFRPVLMTALAMIIGMVPMALGLGEGGEQNAPLGRAVIGGLLLATVATSVLRPGRVQRAAPEYGKEGRRSEEGGRVRAAVDCCAGGARPAHLPRHTAAGAGRVDADPRNTRMRRVLNVSVVHPKLGAPADELVLPGNIEAFTDTPVYARTDGYLKRWYMDIGARVKAGQLLAEIETPEIDQQLWQARAQLETAQANLRAGAIDRGALAVAAEDGVGIAAGDRRKDSATWRRKRRRWMPPRRT